MSHAPWHQRVIRTYVTLEGASTAAAFQIVVFAHGDEPPALALVAVARDLWARPDYVSVSPTWPQVHELATALVQSGHDGGMPVTSARTNEPATLEVVTSPHDGSRMIRLAADGRLDTFMHASMAHHMSATLKATSAKFSIILAHVG